MRQDLACDVLVSTASAVVLVLALPDTRELCNPPAETMGSQVGHERWMACGIHRSV